MSKPNTKPCWFCDSPTHYRDDGRYTGFCAVHEEELERRSPGTWVVLLAVSTPRAGFGARQSAIALAIEILEGEAKP